MKISARTCTPAPEVKAPIEPDLEFYLIETSSEVVLRVRDKTTGLTYCGAVVSIRKSNGKLMRHSHMNKDFGLPLDSRGRLIEVGE